MRYALLIGNGKFDDPSIPPLKGPNCDVSQLGRILSDRTIGDFQVQALQDKAHTEVLDAIQDVVARATAAEDLVLIYFSGHGKIDPSGQLCLAVRNTNSQRLYISSVPLPTVKVVLEQSRATKVILILDCCFSGAVGKAFARGSPDDTLQQMSTGLHILTSATSIQVAREREQEADGITLGDFTRELIRSLESGRADHDQDGVISIQDLRRDLEGHMHGQSPRYWGLETAGDLVIAWNRERVARIGVDLARRRARELADRAHQLLVRQPDIAGWLAIESVEACRSAGAPAPAETLDILRLMAARMPGRRWSHNCEAEITCVAQCPADNRVAIGTADGNVLIRGNDQEQVVRFEPSQSGPPSLLAWQRDGQMLLIAFAQHSAEVWQTTGTARHWASMSTSAAITSAALSIQHIATGFSNGCVTLWDKEEASLRPRGNYEAHQETIRDVCFSTASTPGLLAAGSADGTVSVWDTARNEEIKRLRGHVNGIVFVGWPGWTSGVITTGDDGAIKLWDLLGPSVQHELSLVPGNPQAVALSPDGRRLLYVSRNGELIIVDVASRKTLDLRSFSGETSSVNCMFRDDGNFVVCRWAGTATEIWDELEVERSFIQTGVYGVPEARYSPDARTILFAAEAFACGFRSTFAREIDSQTGTGLATYLHERGLASAVISLNGMRVVTASEDRTAKIWKRPVIHDGKGTPEPTALVTLTHRNAVSYATFSSRSHLVATCDREGAHLWDSENGTHICGFGSGEGEMCCVRFSPDDACLAACNVNHSVRIWRLDQQTTPTIELLGHTAPVRRLVWSPDGTRIATASDDRTAIIWIVEGKRIEHRLVGHSARVRDIAWSADNTLIATASDDRTIRLWDPGTGLECGQFAQHPYGVRSVEFSRDATRLLAAVGNDRGSVQVYQHFQLHAEDLAARLVPQLQRGRPSADERQALGLP